VTSTNAGWKLEKATPIFVALGDPTRLRLVARLSEGGPQSIARLTEGTDITRQGVTKHLQILAEAGIVRGTREGRECLWQIDARRLETARSFLERASRRWDDALERLRVQVEGE
jgi:DNA-binding transcriptional ArsR family regulator